MPHPLFSDVIGHQTILDILSKTLHRPAPAYLFFGPDGVGKRLVAERFAQALLGLSATDTLDAHPDFLRLVREEKARSYTVEQIRHVIERMQMSTARGGKKVALISDAERLQEEASNALLKAVEEPSPNSVYVFVTESPERLPATLRSRLTPVAFGRVSSDLLRTWISSDGCPPEQLNRGLERAAGSPGMLKRCLADEADWSEREKTACDTWRVLLDGPVGKTCGALEQLTQRIEKTDDAEAEWRTFLSLMMREYERTCEERPEESTRMGHGLFHAWRLVGSSLSPRLALEWSAIQPYLREEPFIPSFLHPSYL